VAAVLTALGCAARDDESPGAGSARAAQPRLVVSAASSLKAAFTAYGDAFSAADVKLSFAGSDELAAQIRQGVAPDVYAAANAELPAKLHEEGIAERPTAFATNRLVIAVPRGSTEVRSLEDLARPGTTLAIGAPSVPVGAYTRRALGRLARTRRAAILANVRSEEPDVAGIVGKLTQGAVDAGLVYATDVTAAGSRLEAVDLPPGVAPRVTYAVTVVRAGKQREPARRFIRGLFSAAGARALRTAGFGPPPR